MAGGNQVFPPVFQTDSAGLTAEVGSDSRRRGLRTAAGAPMCGSITEGVRSVHAYILSQMAISHILTPHARSLSLSIASSGPVFDEFEATLTSLIVEVEFDVRAISNHTRNVLNFEC